MIQHKKVYRLSMARWRMLLALLLVLTSLVSPASHSAFASVERQVDNPPDGAANHSIFLPFVTADASTAAAETVAATVPADVPGGIDARLAQAGPATFWVILKEQADLSPASNIPNWEARGRFVFNRLQVVANTTQPRLRALLQQRRTNFAAYWILNAIRTSGDQALRDELIAQPEVAAIVPDQIYQIPEPTPGTEQITLNAVEWNIDRINAPQVWSTFAVRGEGIVVANIDSGVQYDHPALVRQYRGALSGGAFDHNYNWFDPSNVCGSPSLAPCDNNGHGTHTMGTMVGEEAEGANQIGVAPGVRWVAAKGCETNSCSTAALLAAGQWVVAPTDLGGQNPRPDLRPHIVNNSWGGPGGDIFYQATVNAWVAAGIFPAFSNGNSGPSCSTSGSPGDNIQSYSSGAFDINNNIASFSSRGVSLLDGEIKPNIAAPGVNVRSSLPTNTYGAFNGTSMASPHTAATVALMWSAAPALVGDVAQTRALLDQTASDVADLTCGGTAADNNVWGEGRLNAFAAVDQSPRGSTGTLTGVVTDGATGAAIAGATLTMSGPTTRTITTNANGQYNLRLLIGNYNVTMRAFGYFEQTVNGVVISQDQTTTQNAGLVSMPRGVLQGTVTDAGSGAPIAGATVDAVGAAGALTAPTDGNGQYNFPNLPVDTYAVTVRAFGFLEQSAGRAVINQNQTTFQDFSLASAGLWTAVGNMNAATSNHLLTLLGDGRALSTVGRSAEIYNPATRTWTTTSSPTDSHLSHTATRLNDGRVLVAGGLMNNSTFPRLNSAELYEPSAGVWSPTGSLSTARSDHVATLLSDGRVLVTGGFCCASGGSDLNSVEIYNPATGVWSPVSAMINARRNHIAIQLNDGRVLVAGGVAGTSGISSAEIYNPTTGLWSPTGSRAIAGFGFAWLLNDGRVLFISVSFGKAEVYDPPTGVWSPIGGASPTLRTGGASATMLPNGMVLIAGGVGADTLKSAELFDPATGRWLPTRDMSFARSAHPALLLADGQVLVAGGTFGFGAATSNSELFDLPPDLLQGKITDAATGAPLATATVRVSGSFVVSDVTGVDGFYSLLLRPGTYAVTARAFGYIEQTIGAMVINQDQTVSQNFALAPIVTRSVSGQVRNASGAPVANVSVTILGAPLPPAITDVNGFYSFASVPEGVYTVRAEQRAQCLVHEQALTVAGGPATLNFTLAPRSDSFGYTCQLVTPAYVEATNFLQIGSGVVQVTLPFPFSFYGQSHSTAWVYSGGYLAFVQNSGFVGLNTAIPNTAFPNGAIYPFWESVSTGGATGPGSVSTATLGTAPNRRFVIEWRNMKISNSSSFVDFEAVLHENGSIIFQYRNLDPAIPLEQGSSTTVGIENQTGTVALQYSFDEPILTNATAILFQVGSGPPPPPASITVSTPNGGESWKINTNKTIRWSSQSVTGNVKIEVSRDGGASYAQIAASVANNGAFVWQVTGPATTQARIRVSSVNQPTVQDASNNNFRIRN